MNRLLGGSSARFSPCRRYRYELWRRWDESKPYAMFVGLNPSTADEVEDDPTIRRCIRFARDWGYGALCMTNLFALRATDPRVMLADTEPEGPENDQTLLRLAYDAGIVVAAWGAHGGHRERDQWALWAMLNKLHHLGLTKDGKPRHPLYLRADARPQPLTPNAEDHARRSRRVDSLVSTETMMGYETRLTERERGIWRAALTLANNICVQESDRHNADDETREADTANECAKRVRGFIDADDKQLAELFAEAGVADDGPDPICESLNSGDGSYRP